ncbi:MAG: AMP-binding protein [Candidatus Eutrophobiaceae bacterium]
MIKLLLRIVLKLFYRIEVEGLENYPQNGKPTLIISNHASLLDGILLYAFLPESPAFAINRDIAAQKKFGFYLRFVRLFELDNSSPLALRNLVSYLRANRSGATVIFPEGRVTVTGRLMKIYEGAGLVADRAGAQILPIHIDGAQYSRWSYLSKDAQRWFPKLRMRIFPPVEISFPKQLSGHERRMLAAEKIRDLLYETELSHARCRRTLFAALYEARRKHGHQGVIIESVNGQSITYQQLFLKALVMATAIEKPLQGQKQAGVMLPNIPATIMLFLALQYLGKTVAMLNFTMGSRNLLHAVASARIKTLYTSRSFVEKGGLEKLIDDLSGSVQIVYLEDIANGIGVREKLSGFVKSLLPHCLLTRHHPRDPDDPATILFTSGSESLPKGVALSHFNILSNYEQTTARIDFLYTDKVFSCLPLFHTFGLSAGFIIPLLSGARVFLYISPLHFRLIPDLIYQSNCTILTGSNTLYRGYARYAHPGDFRNVRYALAGAEKLQDNTHEIWQEKFGVSIYQGYGVTETSPVISMNTWMENKRGTTGRLLPGMQAHLEPIEGIDQGGRLYVKGPNIMLGYLLKPEGDATDDLRYSPPCKGDEQGWHDTGDIADIDPQGYITILGRAKRFAKIGGEMISLTAVEQLAAQVWPNDIHAAVAVPDKSKGECILLFSSSADAQDKSGMQKLRECSQEERLSPLYIPKKLLHIEQLPTLSTGKTDYQTLQQIALKEA